MVKEIKFATTMENGQHTKEWTCMQKALPC